MALAGSFDVLDIGEVLQLLASKQATGRLSIRTADAVHSLTLRDGELVAPDGTEALVTVCFEVLGEVRGSFDFQPGAAPAGSSVASAEVLQRARRRQTQWREIQRAVPTLEVVPQVRSELTADEVTLDREQWRLLVALDGRHTARAAARRLGLGEFDGSRVLKSLLDSGLVELDDRAPRTAIPVPERGGLRFVDGPNGNGDAHGSRP